MEYRMMVTFRGRVGTKLEAVFDAFEAANAWTGPVVGAHPEKQLIDVTFSYDAGTLEQAFETGMQIFRSGISPPGPVPIRTVTLKPIDPAEAASDLAAFAQVD
jgi:hypothetical protein